jgi:hypothetical protein
MSRVSSLFSCKKHNIFSQKNENIPKNFDASSSSANIYGFNTAFCESSPLPATQEITALYVAL